MGHSSRSLGGCGKMRKKDRKRLLFCHRVRFINMPNTFSYQKICSLLTLILILALTLASDSATLRSNFSRKSGYQYLGQVRGQGVIQNYLVGPGKSASNQLFYLNYSYISSKLDFVAIDPNTGNYQVFPSPVSTEQAAWGLISGPDNNI